MLSVRIAYRSSEGRRTPIVESLKESTLTTTARSILSEYVEAADACPDEALAPLIRTEARRVLIAAGLPIAKEAGND